MKIKFLALLLVFFISCSDDKQSGNNPSIDYPALNDQEIQEYLAEIILRQRKAILDYIILLIMKVQGRNQQQQMMFA